MTKYCIMVVILVFSLTFLGCGGGGGSNNNSGGATVSSTPTPTDGSPLIDKITPPILDFFSAIETCDVGRILDFLDANFTLVIDPDGNTKTVKRATLENELKELQKTWYNNGHSLSMGITDKNIIITGVGSGVGIECPVMLFVVKEKINGSEEIVTEGGIIELTIVSNNGKYKCSKMEIHKGFNNTGGFGFHKYTGK